MVAQLRPQVVEASKMLVLKQDYEYHEIVYCSAAAASAAFPADSWRKRGFARPLCTVTVSFIHLTKPILENTGPYGSIHGGAT